MHAETCGFVSGFCSQHTGYSPYADCFVRECLLFSSVCRPIIWQRMYLLVRGPMKVPWEFFSFEEKSANQTGVQHSACSVEVLWIISLERLLTCLMCSSHTKHTIWSKGPVGTNGTTSNNTLIVWHKLVFFMEDCAGESPAVVHLLDLVSEATIYCNKLSFHLIFGKPYRCGIVGSFGFSFSYISSIM